MEGSMSLKKRAIEGIVVAGSLVMMSTIAQAADLDGVQVRNAAVQAETDFATVGTAGVVARLDQLEAEAFGDIEAATAGVNQTGRLLVATAEEAVSDTEAAETLDAQLQQAEATEAQQADAEQSETEAAQSQADGEQTADAEQTDAGGQPEDAQSTDADQMSAEEQEWQNRLMADVDDFLYIRESGDENAAIVGKLYKEDVAEITEAGDTWTHVESGNVDGYVKNSYCVTGSEAYTYANDTFDTEVEIQTNGLRIRSSADPDASVLAAVSTGMTFPLDADAETVDGWVAIDYKGTTGYVSAEYVTTELALGEAVTIEEEQAAAAKAAAEAAKSAQVSSAGTVQNSAVAASVDDVTLLAALIQCEAGNECYEGQLAVGAVVMNRVRSGRYAGSIYGVIYQAGQFPPAGRGSVASIAANGPKSSCIQAAQEAINGADNTGGATCFSRASRGHAGVVIGNHVFY